MDNKAVKGHIVNWLKSYSESSKTKGFVIGISGGIDSAVTSSLVASTGLPLLCLEMPIYQDANQVSQAKEHIHFLEENYSNVTSMEVELTSVFEAFLKTVPDVEVEEDRFRLFSEYKSAL